MSINNSQANTKREPKDKDANKYFKIIPTSQRNTQIDNQNSGQITSKTTVSFKPKTQSSSLKPTTFGRSYTPNVIRKDGNYNYSLIKVPSTHTINKKLNFGFNKYAQSPNNVNVISVNNSNSYIQPKQAIPNERTKLSTDVSNSSFAKSKSITNKRYNNTNNKPKMFNAITTSYLLSNHMNKPKEVNDSFLVRKSPLSSNLNTSKNYSQQIKIVNHKSTSKSVKKNVQQSQSQRLDKPNIITRGSFIKINSSETSQIQQVNKPVASKNNIGSYSLMNKQIKNKTNNIVNKPNNVKMEFLEEAEPKPLDNPITSINLIKFNQKNETLSKLLGKTPDEIRKENDTSPFAHRVMKNDNKLHSNAQIQYNKVVIPSRVLAFSKQSVQALHVNDGLSTSQVDEKSLHHKLNINENHGIISHKKELFTGANTKDYSESNESREGPIYNKIKLSTNSLNKDKEKEVNILKYDQKTSNTFVDELFNSPTLKSIIQGSSSPLSKVNKTIKCIKEFTKTGFQGGIEKRYNQDIAIIYPNFCRNKDVHFLSVCDGHGSLGHEVSRFIKATLPSSLENEFISNNTDVFDSSKGELVHMLIEKTFNYTNNNLNVCGIDTKFSGSTCVSMFLSKSKIITSNIGDSRAVLGKFKNGSKLLFILTKQFGYLRI